MIWLFFSAARRSSNHRNRKDQRELRKLHGNQWLRPRHTDMGPGAREEQHHATCRGHRLQRAAGLRVHGRVHHRAVGSHHRCQSGETSLATWIVSKDLEVITIHISTNKLFQNQKTWKWSHYKNIIVRTVPKDLEIVIVNKYYKKNCSERPEGSHSK